MESRTSLKVALLLVGGLQLLVLGSSVGEKDEKCPVVQYPVNVKVLLDSNAENTYGMPCRVLLCYGGGELRTGYIYFPSPIMYPVRIYMNITYSFMDCQMSNCTSGDLELQIIRYNKTHDGYAVTDRRTTKITIESSTSSRQFFFDSDTSTIGVNLTLRSYDTCVTVSRVLVYHYQCPGHDRQPTTGLDRRPATQAPVTGAVVVNAERSYIYFPHIIVQGALICTSKGKWLECDYSENEVTCKENRSLSTDVEQLYSSTITVRSTPSPTPDVDQIAVIMNDRAAAEDCSCEPQTVFLAVVAVLVVVIFALVLVVVALIIALVGTNRKLKLKERNLANSPDRDMSNPVYDPVGSPAAPNVTSSPSGATNGNGTTDQEQDDDDETLHNFSNNLYSLT